MYMQFGSSCLEIDVAERLELAYFQFREFYEDAPVSRVAFEIGMTLPVQIRTHFLDLEIGHVTYAPAQSAFMSSRAAELEAFEQSAGRQHLAGSAYDFGEADVAGKNADDMCASCYPDDRFIFFCIDMPVGVNLEKLRMKGSLKQTKHQFINCYIDLW